MVIGTSNITLKKLKQRLHNEAARTRGFVGLFTFYAL